MRIEFMGKAIKDGLWVHSIVLCQSVGLFVFLAATFGCLVHAQPGFEPNGVGGQGNSSSSIAPTPFRINTDIYIDEKKAPVKQTLTLFRDGVFYDFEDVNEEAAGGRITVIDPKRNRIVLIDKKRQIKTTLDTQQIQVMVASARVQVDAKLATVKKAEIRAEEGQDIAIVQNDSLEYRSTMQRPATLAVAKDVASQYCEFADWSARLNAVYLPKLPPYLRLDLNRLIKERDMLPKETRRISHQGVRKSTVVARVEAICAIGNDDATRIARVSMMLVDFREVPVAEYWNGAENVASEKTATSTK